MTSNLKSSQNRGRVRGFDAPHHVTSLLDFPRRPHVLFCLCETRKLALPVPPSNASCKLMPLMQSSVLMMLSVFIAYDNA